ncbi:MAG: hypothetical protein ACTHM5_20230, partial [Ginsengibacter sp.]
MMLKRLLLLLFISSFYKGVAAQATEQESNLKAAFIYNFTKYIDWGNYNDRNEFVIDVLGDT